MLIEKLNCES